jgi:DnaJ-domain-containing protein 1
MGAWGAPSLPLLAILTLAIATGSPHPHPHGYGHFPYGGHPPPPPGPPRPPPSPGPGLQEEAAARAFQVSSTDRWGVLAFDVMNELLSGVSARLSCWEMGWRDEGAEKAWGGVFRAVHDDDRPPVLVVLLQRPPLDMDLYDRLGVPFNATARDIQRAYRRLALKLHPDKHQVHTPLIIDDSLSPIDDIYDIYDVNDKSPSSPPPPPQGDPGVESRFKSVGEAYRSLSEPSLRLAYHLHGPGGLHAAAQHANTYQPAKVRVTRMMGRIMIRSLRRRRRRTGVWGAGRRRRRRR